MHNAIGRVRKPIRQETALAKQLSEEGGMHKQRMENLNTSASAWIFRENNLNKDDDEVDLHNLYVKEAIAHAEKGIEKARKQGISEIRLIVGKGLHSERNEAKIKPALEDFMKGRNMRVGLDPNNTGILIARLT